MNSTAFGDIDQAHHLIDAALSAVRKIRSSQFWRILPDDLLTLGRELEELARTVYAAQVHLTGEIDTRRLADAHSCSSTAALLRQALNISAADAIGRVKAARHILPRETPTGAELPPTLPLLAAAVDSGRLGSEHIKTVVEIMDKIPPTVPEPATTVCEQALVDTASTCDPNYLSRAAERILERVDPDGDYEDSTPDMRMSLDFGARNIRTGLTPIKGHLDDHGVEVVKKATDALAAPRPASDGTADPRTPGNRRASALVAALRGYLDAGTGPGQGGERPHLTVILNWDVITGAITDAGYDTGGHLSPAEARRLLCDASVIPAVMGSNREILDIGRKSRTFSPAVRRAIAARDRGCIWDGCDRPPDWCDGHHVQFWTRDFGPTSYHNGVLLCPFHHAEIHKKQWRIRMASDGIPELIPPKWIDPGQLPRRNKLHHFAVTARP